MNAGGAFHTLILLPGKPRTCTLSSGSILDGGTEHTENCSLSTGHFLPLLVIGLWLWIADSRAGLLHKQPHMAEPHVLPPAPGTQAWEAEGSGVSPVRPFSPSVNRDWNSGDCSFMVNRCRRSSRRSPAQPPLGHERRRHLSICDTDVRAQRRDLKVAGKKGAHRNFLYCPGDVFSCSEGKRNGPVVGLSPGGLPGQGLGSQRSAHRHQTLRRRPPAQ